MCCERGQSVGHIVSECSKLAQREYKKRHDNVARYVHWKLRGKANLERSDKWFVHKPEGMCEYEHYIKLLWDMTVQGDQAILRLGGCKLCLLLLKETSQKRSR